MPRLLWHNQFCNQQVKEDFHEGFGSGPVLRVALSVLLLGILALAGPPAGHYHLLKKVPLGAAPAGGREYFDYVTVDSHGTGACTPHTVRK